MKLGTRCTACGRQVARSKFATCGQCGRRIHADCRDYETTFDCRDCAEEGWIGAVEF